MGLTEATDNAFYQGGFNYDYLDFLLSGEVDHDNVEEEDFDKPKIEFRDFPVEQGYVRIPVQYPGLTLAKIQAPNPKLWTAEESFITQGFRPSTCSFLQHFWDSPLAWGSGSSS